jgi:hypothetical protein
LTMVIDLSRTTGVPRTPKLDTHMDDDDKTVLSSGKSNRIHPKTKKLCIKWTIQHTDTTTTKLDLMKEHLAACKAIFDVSEHITMLCLTFNNSLIIPTPCSLIHLTHCSPPTIHLSFSLILFSCCFALSFLLFPPAVF